MRRYSLANNNNNSNPNVRIVVLGDRGVGKSALVVRFLTKRFIGEYASNIEISYQHEVNLGGNWVTAEICDALLEQDRSLSLKKLAPKTDAYLLVYSVCNRDSFDYACSTAHEIQLGQTNNQQKPVPILMVGNKSDLDHFREVKRSEGEEFVKILPNSFFIETSAAESYAEVEDAFRLAFRLVKTRINISPTQFAATHGQTTRRRSFRQVAHLIRGHLSSNARSTTSLDDKNVQNGNDQRNKRRPPRYVVNQSNTNSGFYSNHNPALNEKCVSLSTLNETPNTSGDSDRDVETASPTGLYQHSHYHTMDSAMSTRFTANSGPWIRQSLKTNRLNKASSEITISTSTDENFDLSDHSMLEDDIFLPEHTGAHTRRKTVTISSTPSSDKTKTKGVTVQRKTSMNKKNLTITVNGVHSDGECIEKALQESSPNYPPKSAPVLASTSSKFRFFPNGVPDHQENSNQSWASGKNGEFSVSPLLEVGGKKPSFQTFKEEKRNPAQNLLKQFLKGTFYGPSSKIKETLSPATSDSSISSASTLADDRIYFRASTTSLASMISNDSNTTGEFEPTSRRSHPTTNKPKVYVQNDLNKTRRPSFREAVGELIRKRKKTRSNDFHKHPIKERVF